MLSPQQIAELQAYAMTNLSNFSGDTRVGNTDPDAVMFDNDLVSFQGPGVAFENEQESPVDFAFSITNNSNATKTFILVPGLLYSPTGTNADGVIKDGDFKATDGTANAFTATADNGSSAIALMLAWCYKKPTRVTKMVITCSSEAQAAQKALKQVQNPFIATPAQEALKFNKNINSKDYNPKILTYTNPIQFDDETTLSWNVLAGANMYIVLTIGGVLNNAKNLAHIAQKNFRSIAQKTQQINAAIVTNELHKAAGIIHHQQSPSILSKLLPHRS